MNYNNDISKSFHDYVQNCIDNERKLKLKKIIKKLNDRKTKVKEERITKGVL